MPKTFNEALTRVRASSSDLDGFAFLGLILVPTFLFYLNCNVFFLLLLFSFKLKGDATDIRYQVLVNCDLQMVGEDF